MADPSEALRHMAATRNAVANLDRAEAADLFTRVAALEGP